MTDTLTMIHLLHTQAVALGHSQNEKKDLGDLDSLGDLKSSITHVLPSKPPIVAVLDAKTRVIAADVQWIIQRRSGRAWASIYFCRTKAGMLLFANSNAPELLALPDRFPERGVS